MKKLFVLGLGLAMFIAGMFVASLMNKPERTITDEEAVYAYFQALGESEDIDVKIDGSKEINGDDFIAYTVYKGDVMIVGSIERSYAQQFVE